MLAACCLLHATSSLNASRSRLPQPQAASTSFPLLLSRNSFLRTAAHALTSALYLQANTKPCPKCSVPVEKDGGCNLVMCRSCRQAFCWLCGAKTGIQHTWSSIEGHTCGSWKEEMDTKIEDSKRKHERYMHYYKHYNVRPHLSACCFLLASACCPVRTENSKRKQECVMH
jgi:hypothetical protein